MIRPPESQKPRGSVCRLKAEVKQLATAKTFLFDGSDLLPGAFGDTWGFALQDVIQKPGNIKSILSTFQSKIKGQF